MKIALATTVVALAFPAVASANWAPYVPPSNSGANQYVESVPSASGNTSTGTVRSHRPHSGKALAAQPGPVSPSTESALLAAGRPGRVTAVLAATTGPQGLAAQPGAHRTRTQHSGVAGSPSGPSSGAGGSGSSGAGSVVGAVTGTGGASGLLPVVLALSALALAGIAVSRRRRLS